MYWLGGGYKMKKELPETICPLKLKTLKDLHLERVDTRINDILKDEAIKRSKLYTKKANIKGLEDSEIKYWTARRIEVMEFNNLTEEDLK